MSRLFHRDNARRISLSGRVLKQVSFGSHCSFVVLKPAYMRQVIRQMLVIRQRVHSKDYWVKVLILVVFF